MDRDSSAPIQTARNQFLNVVYFVESAKTHTIRINLRHARWAIAAATIVCLWALGSIAWVIALESQVRGTREHLATSLTALFAYQVKSDKVFDAAYPSDATANYYSESAQLASNSPIIDSKSTIEKIPTAVKSEALETDTAVEIPSTAESRGTSIPTTSQKIVVAEKPVTAHDTVAAQTTNAPPSSASEPNEPLIKISAVKATITGNKLSLAFNITNPNSIKAEGYIWAVAKINRSGQPPFYLSAPNYVKIRPNTDEIAEIKTAYRFSIKSFKSKSFDFTVPPGSSWTASNVAIHFSNVKGTFNNRTVVPVDNAAPETAPSPSAATPETTPEKTDD